MEEKYVKHMLSLSKVMSNKRFICQQWMQFSDAISRRSSRTVQTFRALSENIPFVMCTNMNNLRMLGPVVRVEFQAVSVNACDND